MNSKIFLLDPYRMDPLAGFADCPDLIHPFLTLRQLLRDSCCTVLLLDLGILDSIQLLVHIFRCFFPVFDKRTFRMIPGDRKY